MKLNLNEQVKAMLIKAAEQDQQSTGNICALSGVRHKQVMSLHYANVAILAYYSDKTIQSTEGK